MDADGCHNLRVALGQGDGLNAARLVVANANQRDHTRRHRSLEHRRQVVREGRIHQVSVCVDQHAAAATMIPLGEPERLSDAIASFSADDCP
jgi:hypothetical protein